MMYNARKGTVLYMPVKSPGGRVVSASDHDVPFRIPLELDKAFHYHPSIVSV